MYTQKYIHKRTIAQPQTDSLLQFVYVFSHGVPVGGGCRDLMFSGHMTMATLVCAPYVSVWACLFERALVRVMYDCMCACVRVWVCVYVHACAFVWMCVCVYVILGVHTHVCECVCMWLYVCVRLSVGWCHVIFQSRSNTCFLSCRKTIVWLLFHDP